MLTSFTDSRRRVWNVGENAVVYLFDPPTRTLACYVHTISEQVLETGVRVTAIEVAAHLPATARAVPYTVRAVENQLFPSFDTMQAEHFRDTPTRIALASCLFSAGDVVLDTIAAVQHWTIAENDETLTNWQFYLATKRVEFRTWFEQKPYIIAKHCEHVEQILADLLATVMRERMRRFEEARGPFVSETITTRTTTTSTTSTSCNTTPNTIATTNPAATRSKKRKARNS